MLHVGFGYSSKVAGPEFIYWVSRNSKTVSSRAVGSRMKRDRFEQSSDDEATGTYIVARSEAENG